jgi:predicted nucleic acid-binding protein
MKDESFFDTNIICYAYDSNEPAKRKNAERLVEKVFNGELAGVVSNQVLVELFNALTKKFGVPKYTAAVIVKSLIVSDHWRKINYTHSTVYKALENSEANGAPFLDALISETMKENGITNLITENENDFKPIEGIKVKNPFR